jgi:hypothetical protein
LFIFFSFLFFCFDWCSGGFILLRLYYFLALVILNFCLYEEKQSTYDITNSVILGLVLLAMLPHSILTSFILLFSITCFCGLSLYLCSSLLGLLLVLVYFGALIILFCYLLMYIPKFEAPRLTSAFFVLGLSLFSISPPSTSSSLLMFFSTPSLLLVLGSILTLAMVVVVFLVDLSRGSFSG